MGLRDAVVGTDGRLAPRVSANGPNLILSQYRVAVLFSPLRLRVLVAPTSVTRRRSPLRNHVGHVVVSRAKPQVCRVAAGAVVAGVAHEEPVRDRPIGEHPRPPMRMVGFVATLEHAVTSRAPRCLPFPAGVPCAQGYARPKAFGYVSRRTDFRQPMAFTIAVLTVAAPDPGRVTVDDGATPEAPASNESRLCMLFGHSDLQSGCHAPGAFARSRGHSIVEQRNRLPRRCATEVEARFAASPSPLLYLESGAPNQ
jgi:hypothetical protein